MPGGNLGFDDFRHKRPLFDCVRYLCAAIRKLIGCAIDGCVTFICQRNGQLYVYETRIGFLFNFDLFGRDPVINLEIGLPVGAAEVRQVIVEIEYIAGKSRAIEVG